jgi:hypothetical protein
MDVVTPPAFRVCLRQAGVAGEQCWKQVPSFRQSEKSSSIPETTGDDAPVALADFAGSILLIADY